MRRKIGIFALILFVFIVVPISIKIAPSIMGFVKANDYIGLEAYLRSFGAQGVFFAVVLQILQVMTIVMPAPLVWITVGAVFGSFWGLLICLFGTILGNAFVFLITRSLIKRGREVNEALSEAPKNLGFFSGVKNKSLMVFLMYIVPGLPNGVVPYICAAYGISLIRFVILLTLASIPTILCSTLLGDFLLGGELLGAVSVFFLVVSVAFFLFINRQKVIAYFKKRF